MDRILVVEDSASIARILERRIRKETPFAVDVASCMAEAVRLMDANPGGYFLAVLDLTLPDAPAGEIVDVVLARSIPVIVVTASFDEDTRDLMLSKQICDFILKRGMDDYDYLVTRIRRLHANTRTRILVADDSQLFRAAYRQILETQLFQVDVARDGVEALAILEANPGHRLVIADYNMPNMDGYAFVNAIRKSFRKDVLSVIVVSGAEGSNLISKFLKIGANDFMRKPFNKEELVCRINANLDMLDLVEENKRLVQHDYMTGIYNRYYFYEVGAILHGHVVRNNLQWAVAVVDIDRLKQINDTHGHDAGDHYIRQVATALQRECCRKNDVVARLGGDEFGILLGYQDVQELVAFFDRIRERLKNGAEPYGTCGIPIALSIGICTEVKSSLDEMVKTADEALYIAKRSGRDRVAVLPTP